MKRSRLFSSTLSFVAFAYLVAMVVTGALPQQRQLVKAEAAGLLAGPPERIDRVEVEAGGRRLVFQRSGAGWRHEGGEALAAPLAEKLSMAVQVMHTSAPVRVMEAEEVKGTDPREFGLDAPALTVTLRDGGAVALRARFGGLNPEKFLRYMTTEDRSQLFLMSLFVGDMWKGVADAASTPAK